jgi:hypothetical protein
MPSIGKKMSRPNPLQKSWVSGKKALNPVEKTGSPQPTLTIGIFGELACHQQEKK